MEKIDEKKKQIEKRFGMSYAQYLHLNKQFLNSVKDVQSGKPLFPTNASSVPTNPFPKNQGGAGSKSGYVYSGFLSRTI